MLPSATTAIKNKVRRDDVLSVLRCMRMAKPVMISNDR